VSVLIALDLPAFDRPANTTSYPLSSGHPFKDGQDKRNLA
jgi:hypothetical protein